MNIQYLSKKKKICNLTQRQEGIQERVRDKNYTLRRSNACLTKLLERKEKQNGTQAICKEIIADNFTKHGEQKSADSESPVNSNDMSPKKDKLKQIHSQTQ